MPDQTPSTNISPRDRQRYRGLRIRMFVLSWVAYAAYYLCRMNLSIAKDPLARAFPQLTNVELGDIDTGYLAAYAVGQFPSGLLGDRIGGKWLLVGGMCATGALNLGMGVAGSVALFFALWTANGLAQSTGWPGATKVFSKWFAVAERGSAMGAWCTCYTIGAIASWALATKITSVWSWRWAFIVPAALVLVVAALLALLGRPTPGSAGLPEVASYHAQVIAERSGGRAADGVVGPAAGPAPRAAAGIRGVLASAPIWILGLTYMTLKFVRYSLLFWLPRYMRQHLGYDQRRAGWTSIAFEVAGFAGPIVAGLVSDRLFGARRPPVVVLMMLCLTGASMAFNTLSVAGPVQNIVGLALLGFFLYGPDSVVSGVAAVDYGGDNAAAATGLVNSLGSVGAALSGSVVGRVERAHGWAAVFKLFPPLSLVGALLMITLWRRPTARRPAAPGAAGQRRGPDDEPR